jgi:predicted anti-sigma-YlaC factor YlaD
MSNIVGCREIRHTLGVYVLGAIDPADRALVDDHLATCLDCREELAGLAGLPALLRRVPTSDAERILEAEPAEDTLDDMATDRVLPAVLERASRVRHTRRLRELVAAAAVAVLALGAGAAGASVLQGTPVASQPPGHAHGHTLAWQKSSVLNPTTGAGLTVKYARVPWGTTMAIHVGGIPAGTVCQFLVTDRAGHRWLVAAWQVSYAGAPVWYPASTSLAEPDLHSFEVTAGGKVLARVQAR